MWQIKTGTVGGLAITKMNKLKTLIFVISIMIISLCSCSGQLGKTAGCNIIPIESEVYTQADYDEACQAVFEYFEENFAGCSMIEIKYAGDDDLTAMKEWAEEYGVDEVIILESSFETDDKGGDGSLNPNEKYSGWQWILVRDKDGKWQHKDHGYG